MTDPTPIDRAAPTREPDSPVLMHQNWHHLLFLHWEVPPNELQALLPHGLDLDTHDGKAYVGLVPFTISGVRPSFVPPMPLISSFHEVNVRTYVHRGGRDPGVWFFSLDASNALAVLGARLVLGLPYQLARIRFAIAGETSAGQATTDPAPTIDYDLQRRGPGPTSASCSIRYAPRSTPAVAPVGSLEYFLVERYVLYTAWVGRLYRGRIHHPP